MLRPILSAAAAALLLIACDQGAATSSQPAPTAPAPAASLPADALVTVNGAAIGQIDLEIELSRKDHDAAARPPQPEDVLERLVDRELFAQEAARLGLDADTSYQTKLRELEAQVDAFRRRELTRLFTSREVDRKAVLSEAEARAYYDAHAAEIRSELHVHQILRRSEAEIRAAHEALKSGKPFDEVAASLFPKLPPAAPRPWDLGSLTWQQVPPAWRDVVYDLEPGETSGILTGPRNRYWLVKLIARRDNPAHTFEAVRPVLEELLKGDRVGAARKAALAELRAKATVDRVEGKPLLRPEPVEE